MEKLGFIMTMLVLAAGCATVEPEAETVGASQEEIREAEKTLKHCESEIAVRDRRIAELEETLAEIEKIVGKNGGPGEDSDTDDLKKLSEQAAEVAERIKKLEQELNATSKEAEQAAARMLVEARCFERDNPTEAKSIITAKYKAVFEKYPRTKAAKEARKRCEELSE